MVLSAYSSYFNTIFTQYEQNDTVVVLKGVKYIGMKSLLAFLYAGEITVENVSKHTYILANM